MTGVTDPLVSIDFVLLSSSSRFFYRILKYASRSDKNPFLVEVVNARMYAAIMVSSHFHRSAHAGVLEHTWSAITSNSSTKNGTEFPIFFNFLI